ncbi:MAG: zinc-ribbon domain-containing protein [Myxococcota bacterium]|jgi:hypothetical protein|nr:zinc-ribbon domain-containing protein [Myxococcota bacterium]
MKCPNCHRTVREDVQFCTECGAQLAEQRVEAIDDIEIHGRPTQPTPVMKRRSADRPIELDSNLPVPRVGGERRPGNTEKNPRAAMAQDDEVQVLRQSEVVEQEPSSADASSELQNMLSRLRSPEQHSFGDSPELISQHGFELGDVHVSASDEDGFSFGQDDDPSGPVPVPPEIVASRRSRKPKSQRKLDVGVYVARARDRFSDVYGAVRRRFANTRKRKLSQKTLVFMAMGGLFALFLLIALFSSGEDESSSEESVALVQPMNDAQAAASAAAAAPAEPSYQLVRLSADNVPEPTGDEFEDSVPEPKNSAKNTPAKRDVPFNEFNALANPPQPKSEKLKRSCVLREGPASRFKLIRALDPGEQISVLASSEEDWETMTVGKSYGWAKGCSGKQCSLRMGPGEAFMTLSEGGSIGKASSRVVSSSRWRYVQAGKHFGWVGPACFK